MSKSNESNEFNSRKSIGTFVCLDNIVMEKKVCSVESSLVILVQRC